MSDKREPISKRIPNHNHRRFIDEYFKQNMNATQAYITVYDADYEVAMANSSRLLRNAKIQEEIEYRLQQSAMSADEAIARLGAQARGSLGDFFTHYEGINVPFLNLQEADKRGLMPLVRKIEFNDSGRVGKIELYSSQKALEDILKVHGKFDTGTEANPLFSVEMSLEEWQQRQNQTRQQAEEAMEDFED